MLTSFPRKKRSGNWRHCRNKSQSDRDRHQGFWNVSVWFPPGFDVNGVALMELSFTALLHNN